MTRKIAKPAEPTPPARGPFRLVESTGSGISVQDDGRAGLTVAWFWTNMITNGEYSHRVTMAEARANAVAFIDGAQAWGSK